jgi:hypothetical protein
MVNPRKEVVKALRGNRWWLIAVLLAVIVWVLASSAVILLWETKWTYLRACYFTVINLTTVGFGDALPSTPPAKVLAGINAFVGLTLFGIFVAILSMCLQPEAITGTISFVDPGKATAEKVDVEPSAEAELLRGLAKFLAAVGRVAEITDGEQYERRHSHIDLMVEGNASDGRIRIVVHHH